MPFPKSPQEMVEQNYIFQGIKTCRALECRARLAIYLTPKNKEMPMNADGAFIPHFATCPALAKFRKPKQPQPRVVQESLF